MIMTPAQIFLTMRGAGFPVAVATTMTAQVCVREWQMERIK